MARGPWPLAFVAVNVHFAVVPVLCVVDGAGKQDDRDGQEDAELQQLVSAPVQRRAKNLQAWWEHVAGYAAYGDG